MKLYVDCEFSNSIACELISIALADEDVGGVIPILYERSVCSQ